MKSLPTWFSLALTICFVASASAARLCTFRCDGDPCQAARCSSYPNAVCRPDLCNGCKATFYLKGAALSDAECSGEGALLVATTTEECSPANCFANPCSVSTCNAFPAATCVPDYCNGCNANFELNGVALSTSDCSGENAPASVRVSSQIVKDQSMIVPGKPRSSSCTMVRCFINPCTIATCPSFPAAECIPDYCNGCNARFVVNGVALDSDACTSGGGLGSLSRNVIATTSDLDFPQRQNPTNKAPKQAPCTPSFCFVNPCVTASCQAYPTARCVPNYCNGCSADFVFNGVALSTADCSNGGSFGLDSRSNFSQLRSGSGFETTPSPRRSSRFNSRQRGRRFRPRWNRRQFQGRRG